MRIGLLKKGDLISFVYTKEKEKNDGGLAKPTPDGNTEVTPRMFIVTKIEGELVTGYGPSKDEGFGFKRFKKSQMSALTRVNSQRSSTWLETYNLWVAKMAREGYYLD